jgi:hypothetical protein
MSAPVFGAESVDFLFNWCDLKILSGEQKNLSVQQAVEAYRVVRC